MIRRFPGGRNPMRLLDQVDLGRWLAVGAIGCTAIAVWALPPRTQEFQSNVRLHIPAQAEREHREAVYAAVTTNARLVREAWLETMLERAAASSGDAVVTWLPDQMPAPLAETLEATFDDALRAKVGRGPVVTTGFFLVGRNQGGHPALNRIDWYGSDETYLGDVDGRQYCFTGRQLPGLEADYRGLQRIADSPDRALRALGVCGFYAKYGVPGEPLSEWLAAGGHRYAGFVFSDQFPRNEFLSARGRFGSDRGVDLPKQQCAAGLQEVCESLFLQPRKIGSGAPIVLTGYPPPPVAAYNRGGPLWFDVTLLGWLEQEHGEEAFAEFWSSELPVKEAFENAYPMTLGIWMRDWTVRMIGPVRSGPAPSSANVFGSLLFIAAGILFSLFVSRRANPRHS